jgi:sterol desaturase/sphingolipid hydroxylase (fatty acid hydroxylase superfamily)
LYGHAVPSSAGVLAFLSAESPFGYPDPTAPFVPVFLLLVAVEAFASQRLVRSGRPFRGYEKRDTWASLAVGLVSVVIVGVIQFGTWSLANALWPYRLVDLGTGVVGVAAALVLVDFTYYWLHRSEHRCRILWAAHVNHHSSEHYNLSTALRQPWTPFALIVFMAPLALLGISPELILIAYGINLIYQFWIHTELVPKLGPVELVLNTPSHHRVHHGSNQRYLDRNYAGILIIWDRMFGTFEPEGEPVVYGLTKNIHTFNVGRIAFHEYAAIGRDARRAGRLRDKLGHVVGPPGWTPSVARVPVGTSD